MFCFIIMAEQKERVYDMGNKEDYKKKIIEMVNKIENVRYLKFIYGLLISFKKKWGI